MHPSVSALPRIALTCLLALACGPARDAPPGATRIVFRYQPLGTDQRPLRALISAFERANPDVRVDLQALPNDSDLAHQLLLTTLGAGAGDLDVFVVDVTWVAELARAGWLADLTAAFPPESIRRTFLPGPAEVVVRDGRTRAVPWFADVGVLYWRTDLVARAPRTPAELESAVREVRARSPELAGFLWQGRQYEGLSCVFFEALWARGGDALAGGRLSVDGPAARDALAWLRGLVASGISPPSVTLAAEEDARRLFGAGRAVFMRNWPYAWPLLEAEGSPVRRRVAIAPLPSDSGAPGPGVLGGWQLAVSARAPPARRAAAERLVAHLSGLGANVALARDYGRSPARRDAWDDPRVRAAAPWLVALRPMLERARPRPVTPWYMLAADALQGELSAAVSGLRPPDEALRRAQQQIDALQGAVR